MNRISRIIRKLKMPTPKTCQSCRIIFYVARRAWRFGSDRSAGQKVRVRRRLNAILLNREPGNGNPIFPAARPPYLSDIPLKKAHTPTKLELFKGLFATTMPRQVWKKNHAAGCRFLPQPSASHPGSEHEKHPDRRLYRSCRFLPQSQRVPFRGQ